MYVRKTSGRYVAPSGDAGWSVSLGGEVIANCDTETIADMLVHALLTGGKPPNYPEGKRLTAALPVPEADR